MIRKLRRRVPQRVKLGHLGTLDPMVCGVLPIAVGTATKVIPYIDDESKEYLAEMTLGGKSDTQDAWGNIVYTDKRDFEIDELRNILASFTGSVKQIPPMFSAVHYRGKRLHELAREGITVEREAREVKIISLELVDWDLSLDLPKVTLKVTCSKGTYVRTLCNDIGERLGTGAYLSHLTRTRSGVFKIEESHFLDKVLESEGGIENFLLPVDYPLQNLPVFTVDSDEEINQVMNGRVLSYNSRISAKKIRVYSSQRRLAAIAETEEKKEGTLIKPVRVFKLS